MVNSPTTKSNRNFPVGVDSLGRAFVNIPFPNEPDIIYNKQYKNVLLKQIISPQNILVLQFL